MICQIRTLSGCLPPIITLHRRRRPEGELKGKVEYYDAALPDIADEKAELKSEGKDSGTIQSVVLTEFSEENARIPECACIGKFSKRAEQRFPQDF